jgi:hypothetical protein
MKKVLLSVLMLSSVVALAQEETKVVDSVKTSKSYKLETYIGFNGNVNNGLNLNKKLKNANLPELEGSRGGPLAGAGPRWPSAGFCR